MKPSNTRGALLAPYEGQLLHVLGRLKEVRTQDDGRLAICIVGCEVRPFDPDVALRDVEPIRIDHLWNRNCEPDHCDRALLNKHCGIGIARQYARKDGSIDWTIETIPSVNLDAGLAALNNSYRIDGRYSRSDRIAYLRGMLLASEEGPCYAFGIATNTALRIMRNGLERLLRNAAVNAAALASSRANGPCKTLRSLSRIPGRQLQRACGFA